jgi:hypothetical protein
MRLRLQLEDQARFVGIAGNDLGVTGTSANEFGATLGPASQERPAGRDGPQCPLRLAEHHVLGQGGELEGAPADVDEGVKTGRLPVRDQVEPIVVMGGQKRLEA